MGNVTRLKTPQFVQTFSSDEALALVQSFHRQMRLRDLLELFHNEAQTLLPIVGMHYHNSAGLATFTVGDDSAYYVNFRAHWHNNQCLGEVYFYFETQQEDLIVSMAEDLVALVASPLHNAIVHEHALSAVAVGTDIIPEVNPNDELVTMESANTLPFTMVEAPDDSRSDTLLLIGLDSYQSILQSNGVAWAQAVLQSVQDQVRAGLREADGLFQIDDGLLALLLPRTGHEAATAVAEKVRELINDLHLTAEAEADRLTACMGIAISRDADSAETVLERAEWALAKARGQGPGAVHVAG